MYKNAQRNFHGGSEFSTEPSPNQRKNGEDPESPSRFSPGLLDLNSFDTELLPEVGLLPIEVHFHF